MKTITIPMPSEVSAQLKAEFPKERYLYCFANFGFDDVSSNRWSLHVCERENMDRSFTGYGDTTEEAFADLRKKIAENDPLIALRKQAESRGMKLVPA